MWSPLGQTFFAPYDPYASQPNGSLLPPTRVYLRNQQTGDWIGPHVYPTTQGPGFPRNGRERDSGGLQPTVPHSHSAPGWTVANSSCLTQLAPGKWNILGTDEQARDQFSRLLHRQSSEPICGAHWYRHFLSPGGC